MSKLNVEVGDEFPIDEGAAPPQGRHGRWHHHHHHGLNRRGFRHHEFHGRGHHRGLARLPMLLIVAGLAALIVMGRIPATAAYAMIGLGLLAFLALAFFRLRHIRRFHRQAQ